MKKRMIHPGRWMKKMLLTSAIALPMLLAAISLTAQIRINEGSNRNYQSVADENGDFPDWIELYNESADTLSLLNYSLTDNLSNPVKWVFPALPILPQEFKVVFCSGKDRKPVTGFNPVLNTGSFTATTGWNTHLLSSPVYWDGSSNILINICSYSSTGYTSNSVFRQTITPFASSVYSYQDGNNGACSKEYGTVSNKRPNIRLNGIQVGTGTAQNSGTDYPAPYGNWYWSARHQLLYRADEMVAAGLSPGWINSISFDVVSTDPNTHYDYLDFHIKLVSIPAITSLYESVNPYNFQHTNFKVDQDGESISLFAPNQTLINTLDIGTQNVDNSNGFQPDGSTNAVIFPVPTPGQSNNGSSFAFTYLEPAVHSVESGFFSTPIQLSISHPNSPDAKVYYTLNGSDPTSNSTLYDGNPIDIFYSCVLKSVVMGEGILPSKLTVSSYFFGVEHSTPILSVITDPANLYGSSGIFDHWENDWEKAAYVEYFTENSERVISQPAGMQIDGGAGGSRSHSQHSFRVELDDGVLGDGPAHYPIIPNRPDRTKYSKFYLRNGSNQYLALPYKDACQVNCLGDETHNYFSAWRPVSVYLNGYYFGLYELREKFDTEYFKNADGADEDSIDILSQSYWYGGSLRPTEGKVEPFLEAVAKLNQLDAQDTTFCQRADSIFDLDYYLDYIIAQNFIGNTDWPYNNIKIYRSDATDFKWRFCLIDVELSLAPNGWTDCYYNHFDLLQDQGDNHPYAGLWVRGMNNEKFRNQFINRYADILNTSYLPDRMLDRENNFFNLTVVEMQREFARWGDANDIPGQMNSFYSNHLTLRDQLAARPEVIRNQIQSRYSISNQHQIHLDIQPAGAGAIHISTIQPDTYPWSGIYFTGIPVPFEAIPAEGFIFSHWESSAYPTNPPAQQFTDSLQGTESFLTAVFEEIIGIHPTEQSLSWKAFPNPANDILHLRIPDSYNTFTIKIIDAQGNEILQTSDTDISVKNLPTGIYILEFSSEEFLSRKKIQIIH